MNRRYAGLLRAVNVGGRKLVMADLRRIAVGCGFNAPTTLLASGNLVFEIHLAPVAAGEALRLAILGEIDLATDVFVRDAGQLQAVVAANPFTDAARDHPSRLAVMFLDREPRRHSKFLPRRVAWASSLGWVPAASTSGRPRALAIQNFPIA